MDMLVAFIFGVMAMYLYRQFRPEPIFRQDIADVCVAQLVEGMANGDSDEDREKSATVMTKVLGLAIRSYSAMRESVR
jgi:hypothetical protein